MFGTVNTNGAGFDCSRDEYLLCKFGYNVYIFFKAEIDHLGVMNINKIRSILIPAASPPPSPKKNAVTIFSKTPVLSQWHNIYRNDKTYETTSRMT